jgi:ADP-ribosylglycohydrolase
MHEAPPHWAVLGGHETLVAADMRMRRLATPIDRRLHPDRFLAEDFAHVTRESMLVDFWGSQVPGSGAWDAMFVGAAASHAQNGFDSEHLRQLVRKGLVARALIDEERCRDLASQLLLLFRDDMRAEHVPSYLTASARAAQAGNPRDGLLAAISDDDVARRIYSGWVGQLAGGAFGTALEGCTGDALAACYGSIGSYIGTPTTLNDDCVYELLVLDAIEQGSDPFSARSYAHLWTQEVPFAWSAEWIALENLRSDDACAAPPLSGWVGNPMFDWIGAQMRSMIFGLLAPNDARLAADLALVEGSISHAAGGLEGAVFAAVLTALAFSVHNPKHLLRESARWIDQSTSYARIVNDSLRICGEVTDFDHAWKVLHERTSHRNWIHAEPNIAAVICSLWFGERDFTTSFGCLARAGLDVDCNAGLVGTVLGVQNAGVDSAWSKPLNDTLETYLPKTPSVSIRLLAERTFRLRIRSVH